MKKISVSTWGLIKVNCDPISCKYGAELVIDTGETISLLESVYENVDINEYFDQSSDQKKSKMPISWAIVGALRVSDRGYSITDSFWLTLTDEVVKTFITLHRIKQRKEELNI